MSLRDRLNLESTPVENVFNNIEIFFNNIEIVFNVEEPAAPVAQGSVGSSASRMTLEYDGVMHLDPHTTALVLIDLQRGITSRTTEPHASADVIARASTLAAAFRAAHATVVLVNVAYSADDGDRLKMPVDQQPQVSLPLPADFAELMPELNAQAGDVRITKRQWGAFYGTELDLQLRRRGITTIVLGGISTNFGVESTARDAWERSYAIVFAEDATASFNGAAHAFAFENIFPRLGIRSSTSAIIDALG